jgi:hypothetical protein
MRGEPGPARLTAALLGALVLYFVILSTGPQAYSRFRVPFTPLLALCAARGLEDCSGGGERSLFQPVRQEPAGAIAVVAMAASQASGVAPFATCVHTRRMKSGSSSGRGVPGTPVGLQIQAVRGQGRRPLELVVAAHSLEEQSPRRLRRVRCPPARPRSRGSRKRTCPGNGLSKSWYIASTPRKAP